jgi:uncharacterized protein YozE (UPF0346 family)
MELTVISKARYDALTSKLAELETQVALVHSMMRAQEETNNQLADIAFDENKFTQQLLDKVDDVAREAARDCIDTDEIAREASQYVELGDEVQRHVERLGCVDEDKVSDLVEEYINDNNLTNMSEVEDAISDYLENNDYVERSDVIDIVQEEVNEMIDERTENVARRVVKEEIAKLIHKLIKENTDATDSRDSSLHLSGTNGEGEARSYNAAGA